MKQFIYVTLQKEGIHAYPAAATDPSLATGDWDDVSFLATQHRHIFHIKVTLEVKHNNRDVEFIQFKRWLERQMNHDGALALNNKSCEMIGEDIIAKVRNHIGDDRQIIVDVSEDGENGAITYSDGTI